jgi:hypothetical protein
VFGDHSALSTVRASGSSSARPASSINFEFHTVGLTALEQRHQRRQLLTRCRHDHLAGRAHSHATLGAELLEHRLPSTRQPRLQRIRCVVEACMQHTAVAAGGMRGEVIFLVVDDTESSAGDEPATHRRAQDRQHHRRSPLDLRSVQSHCSRRHPTGGSFPRELASSPRTCLHIALARASMSTVTDFTYTRTLTAPTARSPMGAA